MSNSRSLLRSNTSSAEVDIDIGPGFQDTSDVNNTSANSNFDDVINTASELTDRIREDNLPKDMGFVATEAIVTVQPTAPAEEPLPIGNILSQKRIYCLDSLFHPAHKLLTA